MTRPGRLGKAPRILVPAVALLGLASCGEDRRQAEPQKGRTVSQSADVPQASVPSAAGTTPMAERAAVIGLLNKRNGISQELELKPGQAVRVGDVVVRLRACETSAPWEVQALTGAFVQLDVRNPQGRFQRVFSGWLYKESPSLNVVEHPVYDVWPKSCAMIHPGGDTSLPPADDASIKASSAPNSAGGTAAPRPEPPVRPARAAPPPEEPEPEIAEDSEEI
jgi:hypothetical protein